MKTVIKLVVSVIAFIAASGATYLAVQKWNAVEPVKSGKYQEDTLEGVKGLTEGEVASLPTLSTLSGEKVDLSKLTEERLLCVFISGRCSGCTMDAELWNDLHAESRKRGVAFYLVDIGDTLEELKLFSSTYKFDHLPILFDPKDEVGQTLRVEFLPQYILFTRSGQVVHRWDGVRRYDREKGAAELARFFQPH